MHPLRIKQLATAKNPHLEFDQLIDESGYSWLHLSYREGKNRYQILHL
jgi:hypothetical protein